MNERYRGALLHVLLGIIVLMLLFIHIEHFTKGDFPEVTEGRWQAVFLDNEQVYFGKITDLNSEYITLTNVYYLRRGVELENNDGTAPLNLVKLGGEFHGPEDMMYIRKDSITFWENLKPESRVLRLIQTTSPR